MKFFSKQFKQILITTGLLIYFVSGFAQPHQKHVHHGNTRQLKEFIKLANQAGVFFSLPPGFKELSAPDNEDYSFDYGMTIPGLEFEIWFQVRSQRENYASYVKSQGNQDKQLANPDSIYIQIGQAHALALSGDKNYFVRNLPPYVLAEYNADAGKTFLLNLLDTDVTRHYKYALLITLQKNHIGTILAVCLTNQKGPDFFKNINKARNCISFK